MKIVKLKKLKDNRYELFLDNSSKLILYDDIIVKYNLLSKNDFEKSFLDRVIKENDETSSYYIAIKYINIKLRSEKEIIKYLERKEFDKKIIAKTISKLKENNFINNKTYLNAYINDQVNLTNNGYYKILKELNRLGFEEKEILIYLDNIDKEVWSDKLNKLVTKKIKLNHKYSGKRLFDKLCYELLNLGYAKEDILNSLENYTFNDKEILKKEFIKIKNKLSLKYKGKELNFHLKKKLLQKGFNYDDIDLLMNGLEQ